MRDFLSRNDVVGHQIVALHIKDEGRENDLNHTQSYLTLETGLCFFMPLGFCPFLRGVVDLTGYTQAEKTLPILNSAIKAVHLRTDAEGYASDEVLIELESGLCVVDRFMAPKGIPTGLFWYSRSNIDWSGYCDYWEWHESHPQAVS